MGKSVEIRRLTCAPCRTARPEHSVVEALLSPLSLLCIVGVLSLAACSGDEPAAAFRVGLITPGSIGDAAWNAGAHAGLELVADSLGVAISHVEARTPGAQEEALRTYAAQNYDLVFGHGFEFQDPAERVAAEFPGTVFIVTSGVRASGNVAPLVLRRLHTLPV